MTYQRNDQLDHLRIQLLTASQIGLLTIYNKYETLFDMSILSFGKYGGDKLLLSARIFTFRHVISIRCTKLINPSN